MIRDDSAYGNGLGSTTGEWGARGGARACVGYSGAGRGGRSASTVQKVVTFAAEQLLPCFVALVASSRLAASGSVDGAGAVPMAYYPPWVTAVSFLRAQLQSAPCARESKSEVGYFITTLGT